MEMDPREIIDQSPHTRQQKLLLILLGFLYGLGTVESLVFSYALGPLSQILEKPFSEIDTARDLGTAGIVLGAIILGWLADRVGRKPVLFASLLVLLAGIQLLLVVDNLPLFAASEFIAGFGRGGMLVVITIMTAEFAHEKYRLFTVLLISALGGLFGMLFASSLGALFLRQEGGWQIFGYVSSGIIVLAVIMVWRFIPESVSWLTSLQPPRTEEKIQTSLKVLGLQTANEHLPGNEEIIPTERTGNQLAVAITGNWRYLLSLTLVMFALFIPLRSLLFELNEGPAAGMGMLLTWMSLGGMLGTVILLFCVYKFSARKVTQGALLAAGLLFFIITVNPPVIGTSAVALVMLGLFVNAGIAALHAMLVVALPVAARGAMLGFYAALREGLLLLAPIAGAFFISTSIGFFAVWVVLGVGCCLAAWLIRIS